MTGRSRTILAAALQVAYCLCLAAQAEAQGRPASDKPRLIAQIGHTAWVDCLAFSADGRLLVTAADDFTVRLWEVATGRQLLQLPDQEERFSAVAISPDSRWLLTVAGNVRLWEAASGKLGREFDGTVATLLPDGQRLLVGSGSKATLYEIATGNVVRSYPNVGESVTALAVSADGKQALWGQSTSQANPIGEAYLWNLEDGLRVRKFAGHTMGVDQVAFSPDGRHVLTASFDATVRLWSMETGAEVRRFPKIPAHAFYLAAFCDNGRAILTGIDETAPDKSAAVLWDTATGKEIRRFEVGAGDRVESVAVSPDSRTIVTGHNFRFATLWDAATGKPIRQLKGSVSAVLDIAVSADSKWMVASRVDDTADLWDLAAGRPIQRLSAEGASFSEDGRILVLQKPDQSTELRDRESNQVIGTFPGSRAAMSPDARRIATFETATNRIRLWNISPKSVESSFAATDVRQILFTRDGRRLIAVSFKPSYGLEANTVTVWDTASGAVIQQFKRGGWCKADVSKDGHVIAISWWNRRPGERAQGYAVQLLDAESLQEIRWLAVHRQQIYALAFSPDGAHLCTGGRDSTGYVWETATGRQLSQFKGHLDWILASNFLHGGKIAVTGSQEGAVRLWKADTGEELCQLINFQDGTWAVVDSEGRFDAANGGQASGLHWVAGLEAIELAQLKDRYYEPGLLAKKLQFNPEPLREVAAFNAPRLYPEIEAAFVSPADSRLRVKLTNRGGGIGPVIVKVNGKERDADARPRGADPDAPQLAIDIDLDGDPRLKAGEKNEIEIIAYNAEGYLASRGLQVVYEARGAALSRPPHLWGILAGVSNYRGDTLDLRFAAKDADDFAVALEVAASRLFGPDQVHLTRLTTSANDAGHQPTRANLLTALAAAREAKPEDILVVYLAGHGISHGGQDGDFYFLTGDAQTANLADPQLREQIALSSRELTEFIKQIPALKQALILDTCASGRLVQKLSEKRDVPTSQIRALERMKDRMGVYVLAGCAAEAVSYEASRYGQGMLTYSLLLGIRGARLRQGEFVDVLDLFNYASDTVPELAKDIGGIQRPVIASPNGGASFDIGRVTRDDQGKIPLAQVRPLVLQSSFQEVEQFDDVLQLAAAVDRALRDVAARGPAAPLVFIEAKELPSAYRIVGRYTLAADEVRVSVNLFRRSQRVAQFAITGSRQQLDALAEKIVNATREQVLHAEAAKTP